MRAFWTGEVAFGLVTIPVKLYSATKDSTPSFQQLHKECGSRINMARRCAKCSRDVKWEEIGKGYEVSKGEYALFTAEELAKLDGDEGKDAIEISEFIDVREVDLAYIDKSYWVGPGGKSTRGYELLREALAKTAKVAVAKVKLRTRTRLGLLRPHGKVFALDTMRFAEEIVPPDEIEIAEGSSAAARNPRELALALTLVEQLSATFDPSKHPDQYRAAFDVALQEKIDSDEVRKDESEQEEASTVGGKVIDLADLLAQSLKGLGKGGARPVANDASPAAADAPPKDEAAGAAPKRPGPKKAAAGEAATRKAKRAAG